MVLCILQMKAIPLCFDGLLWPCCDPVVATFPQAVCPHSRKLLWLQPSTVTRLIVVCGCWWKIYLYTFLGGWKSTDIFPSPYENIPKTVPNMINMWFYPLWKTTVSWGCFIGDYPMTSLSWSGGPWAGPAPSMPAPDRELGAHPDAGVLGCWFGHISR